MPTTIRTLPFLNPASAGLPSLLPSDAEMSLFRTASLIRWWRADAGFSSSGWECRKSGIKLTPAYTALPTVQTIAAYNNKPSLLFGIGLSTNGAMSSDSGQPTSGGFTWVLMGRAGPSDNAYMVGSGDNPAGSTKTYLQHSSNGAITAFVGGVEGVLAPSDLHPYAAGPVLSVLSHSDAENINVLRINRGTSIRTSTAIATVEPASQRITVGAAGTPAVNFAGTVDGGDIAEVMIFDTPLHISANVALLAAVETYFGTRYGIAAP